MDFTKFSVQTDPNPQRDLEPSDKSLHRKQSAICNNTGEPFNARDCRQGVPEIGYRDIDSKASFKMPNGSSAGMLRLRSMVRESNFDHTEVNLRFNIALPKAKRSKIRRLGAMAHTCSLGTMASRVSRERDSGTPSQELRSQEIISGNNKTAQDFDADYRKFFRGFSVDPQLLAQMPDFLENIMNMMNNINQEDLAKFGQVYSTSQNLDDLSKALYQNCSDQLFSRRNIKKDVASEIATVSKRETCKGLYAGPSYTPDTVLKMAIASREDSIKVQEYLASLDPINLDLMATFLSFNLDILIFDKLGNYVVQQIVGLHEETLQTVVDMSLQDFSRYAKDEYGSRLLQVVCTLSPDFNLKALKLFEANFDDMITNIAGSILLSKLIATASSESNYRFILRMVEVKKSYLQMAYFNRLLTTLVSCCSNGMLSEVVTVVKTNAWSLMNDKFGNYVLQIIFTRDHMQGVKICKEVCKSNAETILFRKYPKFFLLKIYELNKYKDFLRDIVNIILQGDDTLLNDLAMKKDSSWLFLTLLTTLRPEEIVKVNHRFTERGFSVSKAHRQQIYKDFILTLNKMSDIAQQGLITKPRNPVLQ
jgi:hypothetical protein